MCNSTLSCCSDKIVVQDKVCTNWQLAAAGTQIIYTDNMSQIISGTGYIKYETGTGSLTVNFLITGVVAPIQTIVIPAGGSSSFTVARFNTISIVSTAAAQGEFCITVRYNL
ncbi:hypothetical protein PAECIP111893_00675 [Paenibacillus plantiphilus]|uniref:DUF3992 domain-containing protein n=2 Tax=Paenibacillus TaxID=44249 RepID=A0ABS7D2F1_9BACL|nr:MULTISPECIES: S-Ena type endospore appendage [Paenibacillus]MBW7474024.1 DUF3992 domain-containing protein [Paenibacillus oenotherae]CAH1195347.1 hypothetical protein PAECIP111893_00675 [Paenibacillus plantiphilus]